MWTSQTETWTVAYSPLQTCVDITAVRAWAWHILPATSAFLHVLDQRRHCPLHYPPYGLLPTRRLGVPRWLREHGFPWDESTIHGAAQRGHRGVGVGARARVPEGRVRAQAAALGGHLEVLRWAREPHCQWDSCHMVYRHSPSPRAVMMTLARPPMTVTESDNDKKQIYCACGATSRGHSKTTFANLVRGFM